jgi:hypothetical protein
MKANHLANGCLQNSLSVWLVRIRYQQILQQVCQNYGNELYADMRHNNSFAYDDRRRAVFRYYDVQSILDWKVKRE